MKKYGFYVRSMDLYFLFLLKTIALLWVGIKFKKI